MKSYSEPDTSHPLDEILRSVNWYDDRIDSTVNCPSAILLNNIEWDSTSDTTKLGKIWFYGDSAIYYHVPKNTNLGYLYSRRIRYLTPLHYDTVRVDPVDSLWQNYVAGHEIGHMVNMRKSQSDSSIMNNRVVDWRNPPHEYEEEDLDYFLVKPP